MVRDVDDTLPHPFATSSHRCARPSSLRADYCATLDRSRRAPAHTHDPPAPCDGRTAPHAWPSTHQPCQQHCMATRSMRLGARVWVGRACDAPRTSLPRRRASASACRTTPARASSARRTLASCSAMRLAPHTAPAYRAVHARTRCLQHRPSWHLSLARSMPCLASHLAANKHPHTLLQHN